MGLSPAQLGLLLSSFFWSYAVFQIFSGWLVDRCNVNAVMIAGIALWSGATAATGWAAGFAMLFAFRLLLGIGESVAYPCYAKIFIDRLDEKQRGVANALIDAGSKLGPALGTIAGGLLVTEFGWRVLFISLGLAGLLWVPGWLRWMPRGAPAAKQRTGTPPGFREILRHRSIFATFVGHFCGNYYWYFLLTWLPYYLVRERHFSMATMALVGSLPPLLSASSTVAASWCSYRALNAGVSLTRVRRTCTVTGLTFATVVILVPLASDTRTAMAILMFASVSYGVFASSHWAITQTIAGPLAVGRWSGMQNFVGNLAGVVAPALTGYIVGLTGNFVWAFAAIGVVTLTGAMAYLFGLGPVEEATWRSPARPTQALPV
jgi:MFS family permease